MGNTAALARPTIMARLAPVERFSQIRHPALCHRSPELALHRFAQLPLGAGEAHRRQKLAVRHSVDTLVHPTHSDVSLDVVIIGREVLVADRPILSKAV